MKVVVTACSRQPLQENLVRDFQLPAANFQMNLVVGTCSHAHFKLMKLIVNSCMKTNMIVQARQKDRLVDLGMAGSFKTESLPVRSEGIWPGVFVLNTAAVENTVRSLAINRAGVLMQFVEEMNAERC
jgi:hypothetical protein